MSIKNGLYKVSFQTPLGIGFGVLMLRDGELAGGDSSMYYKGSYQIVGHEITAQISVSQHSAVFGVESVLGTARANLALTGTIVDDGAKFSGAAAEAPGIMLRASLAPLN